MAASHDNGKHEKDLKKHNDHLMSQLQLGLAELKTTVSMYPGKRNRTVKSGKKSPARNQQASVYRRDETNIKEVKEDIKMKRSSRNTSTPKSKSKKQSKEKGNTSLSEKDISFLISDTGNLRPIKKTNLDESSDTSAMSSICRSSKRLKTPPRKHSNTGNLKPSRKTILNKLKNKSPMKSKCRSRKGIRTPQNISATGNIKPTRNANTPNNKSPIKSILQSSKRIRTPHKGNRVCFSPTINNDDSCRNNDNTTVDTTMMGYDWIAGMIDNDSSLNDRSDNFFDELKEFRKENWNDCKSVKTAETNVSTCETSMQLSPALKHTEKENFPLCCKGNGAYMVNSRLNLVPIHGPYSACPTCKSKPISQCDADGYVRVSIPRSTIKSPYRLRPHRRKSFDPSDSVALSMHCLAGWQAAKPACIRGPSYIDLAAHTAKPGLTSVKALKDVNYKC